MKNEVMYRIRGQDIYFFDSGLEKYPSGNIRWAFLKRIQSVQGVNFRSKESIEFYENGQIKSGELHGDQIIQGIDCKDKTFIFFYPSGKLYCCGLAKPIELQGIRIKKSVVVNENGGLCRGVVDGDQSIYGVEYKDGEYFAFSDLTE